MWNKYYTGYVLMVLSVVFAVWDHGQMTGKLLIAAMAFAGGFVLLESKDGSTNE